jgi:hypothetical protein
MKKFMSKKVNVLGKSIPVLAIFILGLALVSAALVPYLSGFVTGTFNVDSPLELILTGDGASFSVTSAEAFNLIEKDFTLTNKVSSPVETVIEIVVDGDISTLSSTIGEEFETFEIGSNNLLPSQCTGPGARWEASSSYCYWDVKNQIIAPYVAKIIEGDLVYEFGMTDLATKTGTIVNAGNIINGKLRIQFKVNAEPDDYVFTAQAIVPSEAKIL